IELLSNVVVLFMETASLERSITRLPPSTGFDEPPAAGPEPVPPAAPPAIPSGTPASAAAAESRNLLFIRFLGCHERLGTRPAGRDRPSSAAGNVPNPSPLVPNVTIDEVFSDCVTFGNKLIDLVGLGPGRLHGKGKPEQEPVGADGRT